MYHVRSFPVTIGVAAKGTKTAAQVAKARRAIYGGEALGTTFFEAGRVGGAEGLGYFLRDTNIFTTPFNVADKAIDTRVFTKPATRTAAGGVVERAGQRLGVGDVRLAMAADLAGSLEARALAREADTAVDATRAIDEAGLTNTSYNKELQRKLHGS